MSWNSQTTLVVNFKFDNFRFSNLIGAITGVLPCIGTCPHGGGIAHGSIWHLVQHALNGWIGVRLGEVGWSWHFVIFVIEYNFMISFVMLMFWNTSEGNDDFKKWLNKCRFCLLVWLIYTCLTKHESAFRLLWTSHAVVSLFRPVAVCFLPCQAECHSDQKSVKVQIIPKDPAES